MSVCLEREAFAYYDSNEEDWVLQKGDFIIQVGSSSEDIRLTGIVTIK